MSRLIPLSVPALALLVLAVPVPADACTCWSPPVDVALEGSDFVFRGSVEEIETEGEWTRVRLLVHEDYKGDAPTRVDVWTASSDASCGFTFVALKQYLVYADWSTEFDGDLETWLCSRTDEFDGALAQSDLDWFAACGTTAPPVEEVYEEAGAVFRARVLATHDEGDGVLRHEVEAYSWWTGPGERFVDLYEQVPANGEPRYLSPTASSYLVFAAVDARQALWIERCSRVRHYEAAYTAEDLEWLGAPAIVPVAPDSWGGIKSRFGGEPSTKP